MCIKTIMRGFFQALTFGITVLLCAATVLANGTPIPHGTLELVAEKPALNKQGPDKQKIAAGRTFDVGLHFQLEKGWHIYWINPGDSGEPPRVEWQIPTGLSAGAIEWPTPRRLDSGSIVDYGYEDTVLLIVPMHADSSLAAQQTAHLAAEVKLLVCSHEMCIPGKAQLSLILPVKSQSPANDARTAGAQTNEAPTSDLFATTRRSLPCAAPRNWKFIVSDAKDSFVFTANIGHQSPGHQITQAVFFPLVESQIENAAPQKLQTSAAGFQLTLRKSNQLLKPIARLQGVLVFSSNPSSSNLFDNNAGYLIDVPVTGRGETHSTIIK